MKYIPEGWFDKSIVMSLSLQSPENTFCPEMFATSIVLRFSPVIEIKPVVGLGCIVYESSFVSPTSSKLVCSQRNG